MNRKTWAVAIFVVASSMALAKETSNHGRKGDWSWEGKVASTELGSDLRLAISFSDDDQCRTPFLLISGNTQISEFGLTVDDQNFGTTSVALIPGTRLVAVAIDPTILNKIKHGATARIVTNAGTAPISLSGSAMAINAAYVACTERARPLAATDATTGTAHRETIVIAERARPDGTSIYAVGDVVIIPTNIQVGDEELLSSIVGEMEHTGTTLSSVIFVQNGGGALEAAMKIGEFIRGKRANTAVGGDGGNTGESFYCASACVFAFAGGVERTIYLPARIGMHQASLMDGTQGTMMHGQTTVAYSYEYLSRMGVDPAIVIEAAKAGPNEIWWLTGYEAKGYRLATRLTKPHEQPF